MTGRREYSRVAFEAHVEIVCGNVGYPATLLNISLCGGLVQVNLKVPFTPGDGCVVRVFPKALQRPLNFEAEVLHLQNHSLGFKFVSLDIDTVKLLRQQLEQQLGESGIVERELGHWLKG
jgi:hypothetical protein